MKKIALINDLSGFGRCSLTAAIPVVSAMGIQACPLATAVLSAQTGFASYYCDDCTDKMNFITEEWRKMDVRFDGIHSGYLAGPEQIAHVLHFLDVFKDRKTIYLADPVMGDDGTPIKTFSKELLHGMKKLCRRADVCTPNLTELCLLTGKSYDRLTSHTDSADYLARIADTARRLLRVKSEDSCTTVLVTGITRHADGRAYMGNLAVDTQEHIYMETACAGTPARSAHFSGTGDLFAAVICGALVKGMDMRGAMKLAADFLQPAIEDASAAGTSGEHGIFFERYLHILWEGTRLP